MTVDALPPRPLSHEEVEALTAARSDLTAFPISWWERETVHSMVLFHGGETDLTVVLVGYDPREEIWTEIERLDPDRGFDEIPDVVRPWMKEVHGTIPDEMEVAPDEYELPGGGTLRDRS